MALPYLPGNSFNRSLGKTKFHKSHHFDQCNEISMLVGFEKPGIGGEPILGQVPKKRNSAFAAGAGSSLPAWVAFDRQVLHFEAYYQEAVHEKREEQFRIKTCKIYFYLEDDSIQVIEPKSKNACTPQGTIIRRHRIPKPPPNDDDYFTIEDFNLGNEVNFYSKVFKITNCDDFTRNFLTKLGVRINQPETIPQDPHKQFRKALDDTMQPLRPYERFDTLKQFLDHDRHVLRFFCYWDDSDSMFGDSRDMILHYFLSDDTIEVREVIPANSGRDAAPVFIKRARLPKNIEVMKEPGTITQRTLLNVFIPTSTTGRFILDSLKTGAIDTEFYHDSDLTVGTILNVWGRKFVLTECDNFTKEYYKTKYGLTEFNTVTYKPAPPINRQIEYAPYNGFGSEEDSLCSCKGLMPKPPKRDFIKFMEKDRRGLDSNVLRFLARLDTKKPIDMDRRFIISYFLSDDSILVFEPPIRNSGIDGGKFLERGRVKKPNQPMYSTCLSEYYTAQELYIGAAVELNCFKFILYDADEYAFRYLETHSDEFPVANVQRIGQKLASNIGGNKEDVQAFFTRNDPDNTGIVPYEQFRALLHQLNDKLTEHEVMTMARYYSEGSSDDMIDIKKITAISQDILRKQNFEGFGTLMDSFMSQDHDKSGYLDPQDIRTIFHAQHVPLNDDILRAAISVAPSNDKGEIEYGQLTKALNWRDFPVAAPEIQAIIDNPNWQGTDQKYAVHSVNYLALLADLFGAK